MNDRHVLRTPRLWGRPLTTADFNALFDMHQDPQVMATLAPAGHPRGGLLDAAETRHYLEGNLAHWRDHRYGMWLFRRHGDDDVVGRAGLKQAQILGAPVVELAYALRQHYWNGGCATEMATAVLDWGFHTGGLREVVCYTTAANAASRRVMAKLGFRYARDFVHAGLPHVLCQLSASEWSSRMAGQVRASGSPEQGE